MWLSLTEDFTLDFLVGVISCWFYKNAIQTALVETID